VLHDGAGISAQRLPRCQSRFGSAAASRSSSSRARRLSPERALPSALNSLFGASWSARISSS